MAILSLNDVVKIIVNLSPKAAARSGFNLGLIIGKSGVISPETRVKIYSGPEAMAEDGFENDSPEYKAASLYFQQKPRPDYVAVGLWGEEETSLEAVQACRIANREWYGVHICGAAKEDILSVSEYIEIATPSSVLFYTTSDEDVLTNAEGNIFKTLKALNRLRSLGQYSTTPDAAVSIMGYALGANTGLVNSAYTLAYKKEVGVMVEDIDETQLQNIKGNNGNVYINRGATYDLFEQGVMANGVPFDEVINLDVLANAVQLSIMDLLVSRPKVPQTDAGVTDIIGAITPDFQAAVNKGFIAPGVWNGPSMLELNTGDTLTMGYLIQAEPMATQTKADRDARKSPPLYAAIKLAGAIEHVVFQIDVDR